MHWRTCLIILYIVCASESNEVQEWLEVKIAQGPMRGRRDPSEDLFVFYNVPYATAPTGEEKFKAPLPPPKWTEPYDAINRGIICPQYLIKPLFPENILMQEDCLVANIYIPDTKEKNLSVYVYVHGGGFRIGSGDWLTAKNLMKTKDMIVVNFNYRLGIHGFLCLGTEDIPGNAGMKDQVALLRWVQQNIAAFGGNPNDVTIGGGSAGSVSVDLLMLSKVAEGLFHKVIPESGANIAEFAIQSNPLATAKHHAKRLNFANVDDTYALEKFYKTLSYEALTADGFLDIINTTFMFEPCIERKTADEAFLTEPPLNILKRGDYKKLPMLYGFCNMEGLVCIAAFETWKGKMNEKFSEFLPANLKFENEIEREEVSNQIKTFYFGDKIDNNNILEYVNYFSDIFYVYSMLWAVKLHVKSGHNQVYLYEYAFVDRDTPIVPHTNVRGAEHCAQSLAVLDGTNITNANENYITNEFRNMKKIVREIWHNFIKTGNPANGSSLPEWPPAGLDASPHMSLAEKVELRGVLLEERMRFWDGIYQKYYREPIPPPQPSAQSRTEL